MTYSSTPGLTQTSLHSSRLSRLPASASGEKELLKVSLELTSSVLPVQTAHRSLFSKPGSQNASLKLSDSVAASPLPSTPRPKHPLFPRMQMDTLRLGLSLRCRGWHAPLSVPLQYISVPLTPSVQQHITNKLLNALVATSRVPCLKA